MTQMIVALFLVAPEYQHVDSGVMESTFSLTKDVLLLSERAQNVTFFFSEDDLVVSFEHCHTFAQKTPGAHFEIFTDRGHFLSPSFPEIINHVRNFCSRRFFSKNSYNARSSMNTMRMFHVCGKKVVIFPS